MRSFACLALLLTTIPGVVAEEQACKVKGEEPVACEPCSEMAANNGGCKRCTDVPLLPSPSKPEFKDAVGSLLEKLAEGNMGKIGAVLNFAVKIFSMRHPEELGALINNLEAVDRAEAGAKDGAIDPSGLTNEQKFAIIGEKIAQGDVSAMYQTSVAAISLISIFHVNYLPQLLPTYLALDRTPSSAAVSKQPGTPTSGAGTVSAYSDRLASAKASLEKMDVIKTVAIWAVQAFADYHPDVVKMFKLLD